MQPPNAAKGRRPPVLVVQTDDDPGSLARRLAAASSASGIDLRGGREPVLHEQLDGFARERIEAELPARRAAHREQQVVLSAAVEAAASAHGEVARFADTAAERRKQLLEGAFWCEGKRALAAELRAALAAAEAEEAAAAAALVEAHAAVEAATAQEAATRVAIDDAERQLLELDGAGRSEAELRRTLDVARQSAQEAAAAAEVAERRAAEVRADLADAEQALQEALADLTGLDAAGAADPAPVRDALRRLEQAPTVDADASSVRLAADLERLADELAALPPTVVGPDTAELEQAEAAAAEAHAHLDALRRPLAPHEPPPWWAELSRLHAAVVDAEAAAGSGFRSKAGRKRLEEALATERAFLEEIGYPSHLDALMSGGRTPGVAGRFGSQSVADAERAVEEAEHRLFELRVASNAATAVRRLRSDIGRVRALGGALLGTSADQVTADRLRQPRPDPDAVEALWAALAGVGIVDRLAGADDTARAWLAERADIDERRPACVAAVEAAEAHVAATAAPVPVAESDAADYLAAAEAARCEVDALEAELHRQADEAIDETARAALVESLRAHLRELEATLGSDAAAADAAAGAAAAHATAVERAEAVRAELAEVAERAAALASMIDPGSGAVGPADDLTDLGDLAAALRAEVANLDLAIAEGSRGVAGTAARLAAARAALASHQATPPQQPTPGDIAAALATLIGSDERHADVVVEPGSGFGPEGWEILLDELATLGATAPVAIVTADPAFVAWASEQPGRTVEVVSADAVDPGPSAADRIDRAQTF